VVLLIWQCSAAISSSACDLERWGAAAAHCEPPSQSSNCCIRGYCSISKCLNTSFGAALGDLSPFRWVWRHFLFSLAGAVAEIVAGDTFPCQALCQ
jgi:hypothetical protein